MGERMILISGDKLLVFIELVCLWYKYVVMIYLLHSLILNFLNLMATFIRLNWCYQT